MKKCLLLIVLCASVFQVHAQSSPSRIEKKSFSGIDKIRFEHSFGNITVTESDSGQTELEIQYFEKEELEPPVCETSTTDGVLTVKTVYPKDILNKGTKKSFFKALWSAAHVSVNHAEDRHFNPNETKIHYIIAIPKNVAMKVNLKYGSVIMGDFYGDFNCNIDFGNLNAGTFFNSPVRIEGKYSKLEVNKVETMIFSVNFGGLRINAADMLDLQSRYTNYTIGKVGTMTANCSFGNINIDSVDKFDAQSRYINYRIGKVGTMTANCAFGSIDIDLSEEFYATLRYTPTTVKSLDRKLNLESSFSSVKINSTSAHLEYFKFSGRYSDLRLSLDPDLSADFNADLRHGNLSIDDKYKFKYYLSEKDHTRTVKKGTFGDKTPTAKIDIFSSFAKVSVK